MSPRTSATASRADSARSPLEVCPELEGSPKLWAGLDAPVSQANPERSMWRIVGRRRKFSDPSWPSRRRARPGRSPRRSPRRSLPAVSVAAEEAALMAESDDEPVLACVIGRVAALLHGRREVGRLRRAAVAVEGRPPRAGRCPLRSPISPPPAASRYPRISRRRGADHECVEAPVGRCRALRSARSMFGDSVSPTTWAFPPRRCRARPPHPGRRRR